MAGQIATLKLSRGDSQPWGFRLQGGKDWSLPLSVSKVNPGSLADQAGLCVGDIIVKISGQNAESMLHKEAQDVILRSGNNLDISLLKGGTTTWQPKVVPIGSVAKTRPASGIFDPQPVTRTSLAHNQPSQTPAGTSHNKAPAPFATFGTSSLPLVNKQYNSPIGLYSMRNIKETIDAHTEILAPGVKGINFMKPDTPVNTHSAVYQAILEEEAKGKGSSPTPHQASSMPAPSPPFPVQIKHVDAPVSAPKQSAGPEFNQNMCFECGRQIVGVFCRSNDKSYHAECFRCATCGSSLKNVGHFTISDKLYCEVHAPQVAKVTNRKSVYEPYEPPAVSNLNPSASGIPAASILTTDSSSLSQQSSSYLSQQQQPPRAASPLAQAVSAVPWHNTQNFHHVDAPASPLLRRTAFTNKPQTQIGSNRDEQRRSGLNSLYRPTPTPFSSSVLSSKPESQHTTNPTPLNAPKFAWGKSPAGQLNSPESNLQQPFRSLPVAPLSSPEELGSSNKLIRESVIVESSEISSFEQTTTSNQQEETGSTLPITGSIISKPANVTPAPWTRPAASHPPAGHPQMGNVPVVSSGHNPAVGVQVTASHHPAPPVPGHSAPGYHPAGPPPARTLPSKLGSSIPGPGRSIIAGSKEAPKRGRGQLKPSVSPGTRIPICASCQIPIRGPFIVAMNKTWCLEHFNCSNSQCHRSLQEIGFVEEQGQLYCEMCFEQYMAPLCAKCNTRIKGDCLLALDKQWHPTCFACSYCKNPFGNNCFYLEDGQPYCEKDWNDMFTTKCVSCGFPIEAGDRWVEALNNNYHSTCFKCTVCQTNLEGQSFFAKGGRPFCKSHAR